MRFRRLTFCHRGGTLVFHVPWFDEKRFGRGSRRRKSRRFKRHSAASSGGQCPVNDDDRAIVEGLKGRDALAFRTLVTKTHGRLVALVRRTVDADAAEDIVQQTWEAVVRSIDQFDGRCRLETWIVQNALNRGRTAFRDGLRRSRVEVTQADLEDPNAGRGRSER